MLLQQFDKFSIGTFSLLWGTYLLVLVVDERSSFSAIDAHIYPCLIQAVLEDIN